MFAFVFIIIGWLVWKFLSSPFKYLTIILKGLGLMMIGMGTVMGVVLVMTI